AREGRRLGAGDHRRRLRSARLGRGGAFDPVRASALDHGAPAGDTRAARLKLPARAARGNRFGQLLSLRPGRRLVPPLRPSAPAGPRTVNTPSGPCVSPAPTRARRPPCARSSASRERAASRLLNTPSEIAYRYSASSCTMKNSSTPSFLSSATLRFAPWRLA